jgi:tetratricopeptide (TPR) repeat protein
MRTKNMTGSGIQTMKLMYCLLVTFSVSSAIAAEPAWWSQQKRNCGLSPSLDYNTWVRMGSPCNRSASPYIVPAPPPGPTKEQLEQKDLAEASDDFVDKGNEYYKTGQWGQAIAYYNKALDYNPDNDDAKYNLKKAEEKIVGQQAQDNSQVAAIIHGIRNIQVPPPILPTEAAITFGQIAPEDHTSKNILLGTELGVAVVDVIGKIGGSPLNGTKLIFATGKTFVAAENGADVYLVRRNDTYEKALRYLKDDATRDDFTAIVRALKDHRPIPENASIDMARAAEAILDPKLGNNGKRIAWDAMFSPEARNAALTQVCIELEGEIIGQATKTMVARLMVARQPAFTEATEYLTKARVALQQVEDPAARDSLNEAVRLANNMIAKSYHTVHPGSSGMEHIESIFFKQQQEENRESK